MRRRPARPPGAVLRPPGRGRFDWIQRVGSTPSTYTWVITDKSGTQAFLWRVDRRACPIPSPGCANGNIFRWSLSRVRDVFKNEMKVGYEIDSRELHRLPRRNRSAQYPLRSTTRRIRRPASRPPMTSTSCAAADRSGCNRPDRIVNGRPGFQEPTRCLLKQVVVRLGTQVVRRYDLSYQPPGPANFQKSLLSRIEMRGLDAQTALYRHDFTYFSTPVQQQANTLDRVSVFNPPVVWSQFVRADGAARTEDSLSHAHESTTTHSTHGGVGLFGFNLFDVGGSDTQGSEDTQWQTQDFGGDGLADGAAGGGLFDIGGLVASGADRSGVDLFSGQFTPFVAGSGLTINPISHLNRNVINLRGTVNIVVDVGGNVDLTNTTRETIAIADMNGDGFPDQVVPGSGGLSVRINDGHHGFGSPQPWANYSVSNTSCSIENLVGPLEHLFVDNIGRVIAPVKGVLDVAGDIGKAIPSTGGKVVVKIWKSVTSLFSFAPSGAAPSAPDDLSLVFTTIIDKDSPPCTPGPGNTCSGGLQIPVDAGDRIYLQLSPIESSSEAIAWDPQLSYASVDGAPPLTAAQKNLREPDGSFIYRFSQSADFKPVGRVLTTWAADSSDIVNIEGQIVKSSTSDNVRVRIVQNNAAHTQPVEVLSQLLAGDAPATLPAAVPGIQVQPGDTLSFEVRAICRSIPIACNGSRSWRIRTTAGSIRRRVIPSAGTFNARARRSPARWRVIRFPRSPCRLRSCGNSSRCSSRCSCSSRARRPAPSSRRRPGRPR